MKLKPVFEAIFRPVPPYDFEATVHKPAGWSLFSPFEEWRDGVLWTSAFLGERLFGLRLGAPFLSEKLDLPLRLY